VLSFQRIKTAVIRVIAALFIIILVIALFVSGWLAYIEISHSFAKEHEIRMFRTNQSVFEECLEMINRNRSELVGPSKFWWVQGYVSTVVKGDEIVSVLGEDISTQCGIDMIIIEGNNNNVWFEDRRRIMWSIPKGIVFVDDLNSVPRWYKLTQIEGGWYYYHET